MGGPTLCLPSETVAIRRRNAGGFEPLLMWAWRTRFGVLTSLFSSKRPKAFKQLEHILRRCGSEARSSTSAASKKACSDLDTCGTRVFILDYRVELWIRGSNASTRYRGVTRGSEGGEQDKMLYGATVLARQLYTRAVDKLSRDSDPTIPSHISQEIP